MQGSRRAAWPSTVLRPTEDQEKVLPPKYEEYSSDSEVVRRGWPRDFASWTRMRGVSVHNAMMSVQGVFGVLQVVSE